MKTTLKWTGLICLSTLISVSSWAALNSQLTVVGAKQGDITGDGAKGTIPILSFSDGMSRPSDPASGQPMGRLKNTEFTITKELDKASPGLIEAVATGEVLKTFVLRLYKAAPTGQEQNYFTITLTNAVGNSYAEGALASGVPSETFSFSFQKIQWTDELTHRTAEVTPNHALAIGMMMNPFAETLEYNNPVLN